MNEIRARLYELEVAHPINPREAGRASFFERNGFNLFRENSGYARSPTDRELVQRLKTDFDNTDFQIVFNKGVARTRTNRARAERRQLLTKILEVDYRHYYFDDDICHFLRHIEIRTLSLARNMLPPNSELIATETLLSSK